MPSLASVALAVLFFAGAASAASLRGGAASAPGGYHMSDPENSYGVIGEGLAGTFNICNNFANDNDMNNIGIGGKLTQMCKDTFNHNPDAVHFNPDGNPYKMCLSPGQVEWTGLSPLGGSRVVASDSYSNNLDQSVAHTFSLTGNFGQTASVATTNSVSLSATVGYSVSLLDIITESFSLTTTFSSSETDTHTDSQSASYTSSTSLDVKPGEGYRADLVVTTETYDSKFRQPICLDGYFRCQFGSPVYDPSDHSSGSHYYWYLNVNGIGNSDKCAIQEGKMGASIAIKSSTVTTKL